MDIGEAFRILGIKSSATDGEVKEAYRDCAAISHPDLQAHHPRRRLKATEQLKQINLADETVIQFRKSGHYEQQSQKNYRKYGREERMKNWFTTHEAHPDPDPGGWHVYLQDEYKDLASEISIGDRVLIYETKGNNQIRFRRCRGKMGIVRVGNVTGNKYERPKEEASSIYIGGGEKIWRTVVPTDAEQSNGFVPSKKLSVY